MFQTYKLINTYFKRNKYFFNTKITSDVIFHRHVWKNMALVLVLNLLHIITMKYNPAKEIINQ